MTEITPALGLSAYLLGRRIAGQRKLVVLWDLLYEGQITTTESDTIIGSQGTIPVEYAPFFDSNDGIRLTVNGVSAIYTARKASNLVTGGIIGNDYLSGGKNTAIVDDGGDYYVTSYRYEFIHNNFYTRYPGIYNVRIERALFEPVAYLYNGVRLPPVPNHDSTVFPYVMLSKDNFFGGGEGSFFLWISSAPWQKGILGCTIAKPSSGFSYAKSTDSWEQAEKWADGSPFFAPSNPIWANYDVLNSDGTLYLAASEAVPIYE